MIVFKATKIDMTCTYGEGVFQYRLGVPATAERSKCAETGLHACEYIMDCLTYYKLNGNNRFFKAKAEGDIAEDGHDTRISCTRLILIKELTNREIAKEAMLYMVHHPRRDHWECGYNMAHVGKTAAEVWYTDGIAIARGEQPKVKGCTGAHLGLIQEKNGVITAAKLFDVDGEIIRPDTWYTLDMLMEAERRQQE